MSKNIYGKRPDPLGQVKVSTDVAKPASDIGEATQKGMDALYTEVERYLPGFKDMVGTSAQLAKDWMGGKMSGPAIKRLKEHATAQALDLGFRPGTEFAGFGELADYGVNVMDMQQRGATMAQQIRGEALGAAQGQMPDKDRRTLSAQDLYAAARGEADRAMEIASYNASLQMTPDPGAVAAADEMRMNRISAVSARNQGAAQRSAVFAGSGSGNPFTLANRGSHLIGRRSNFGGWGQQAGPSGALMIPGTSRVSTAVPRPTAAQTANEAARAAALARDAGKYGNSDSRKAEASKWFD